MTWKRSAVFFFFDCLLHVCSTSPIFSRHFCVVYSHFVFFLFPFKHFPCTTTRVVHIKRALLERVLHVCVTQERLQSLEKRGKRKKRKNDQTETNKHTHTTGLYLYMDVQTTPSTAKGIKKKKKKKDVDAQSNKEKIYGHRFYFISFFFFFLFLVKKNKKRWRFYSMDWMTCVQSPCQLQALLLGWMASKNGVSTLWDTLANWRDEYCT